MSTVAAEGFAKTRYKSGYNTQEAFGVRRLEPLVIWLVRA